MLNVNRIGPIITDVLFCYLLIYILYYTDELEKGTF